MGETVLYVTEIIKYMILFRLIFEKKLKRTWIAVLFGVLFAIAFLIIWPEFAVSGKGVLSRTLAVVAIVGMQDEKWGKRGSDTLVVWLLSLMLEVFLLAPLEIIDVYTEIEEQWGREINVAVSALGGVLLFFLYVWKQKRPQKEYKELSKKTVYRLVLVMVVVMLITASGFSFAGEYVPVKWFSVAAIALTAISYFSIGLLGVFVVHIRHVNEKLDGMLQNEMMLKETERAYYEALLEKEEETRRYRHDMVGHLVCLNAFASEKKTEELQEYVQTLQQQFVQIQNKCYAIGNTVLDAITNHYLMGISPEIEVRVEGKVYRELVPDDVALCTIYDNLLKNALEELERIEEGKKCLNITFSQGVTVCEIQIQNSISQKSKEKESLLVTEKEDKKSHGFGLKNVRRVLQECGGDLKLKQEEGLFTASVRIKNNRK